MARVLWAHVGPLALIRRSAGLVVPVHPDEAVVEHGLRAGDGPPRLLIDRVLDQSCLGIPFKHHLDTNTLVFLS